ncbi:MAG: twin-arginine translocation pathway signal protein [Pseudomonadales bacterium]|nr:twin-arginine translocation pathway signal protein [Pseudomonadales bacterium]
MHPHNEPAFHRRSFLKLGVVGSSVLAGAGVLGSLQGCSNHTVENDAHNRSQQLGYLREKDAIILSAVAPAVLQGNFPTEPEKRQQTLDRLLIDIDQFIQNTSPSAQKQIHELFDLLYLAPFRMLVAGIWPQWQDAGDEDVLAFLEDWQTSRFNTLRQGYVLLTQLPTMMYYDQPENWTDAIYPGPPQHIPS